MNEAGELVEKCKPRCKVTDILECESPRLLGNIIVLLYAFFALAFMFTIIGHYQRMFNVISPEYERLGFCISNKDEAVYNRILIYCFYFDTAITILVFGIVKIYDGLVSDFVLNSARKKIGAVFLHGLTHLYQAFMPPPGPETAYIGVKSHVAVIPFVFWFFFLRGHVGDKCPRMVHLAITVAVALCHDLYIPIILSFVYVQFTLQMVGFIKYFLPGHREPHSVARIIIVGVPTSVVSWVEALACESFLWHLGGHLMFDITLGLSGVAHFFYMKAVEEELHSKTD